MQPIVATLKSFAQDLRPEGNEASFKGVPVRLFGFALYWSWVWTLLISDMSAVATLKSFAQDLRPEGNEASFKGVPVRLFGFALYWSWVWTLLISDMSARGGAMGQLLPSSTEEYLVRSVVLLAVAIAARSMAAGRFVRGAARLATALGPLGVAALAGVNALGVAAGPLVFAAWVPVGVADALLLVGWLDIYRYLGLRRVAALAGVNALGVAAGPLVFAAWVPVGVADALLLVGWLDIYRYLGLRRAVVTVCLSSVVSLPILLLVNLLQGPLAWVGIALLPLLCGMALYAAQTTGAPEVREALSRPPVKPLRSLVPFAKVFVLIGAYGLAFGAMQAITYTESSATIPFGLRALAICLGTLLALGVCLTPNASKANGVFRLALPIIACGLLLLPLIGEDRSIAGMIVIVGFRVFDTLSIAILLRITDLHDLPSTSAFAVGRLANTLGTFGGWLVVSALSRAVVLDATALTSASAVMLLILLVTSGALLDAGDDSEEPDGTDGVQGEEPAAAPTGGRWTRQCALISAQYGLSPREGEVLRLLAKGRDAAYIATFFVISPHTAKTHIHNVYKKLGIHSQQELIDLVEDAAASLKG